MPKFENTKSYLTLISIYIINVEQYPEFNNGVKYRNK